MGKLVKVKFCHLMLAALGRAIKGVYKIDAKMRGIISELPSGYTVGISISGVSCKLVFSCSDDGIVIYKSKNTPLVSDLNIAFKNLNIALPMLVCKRSIQQAYSEHDMIMMGDIGCAMVIVDMIALVQSYLFPNIVLNKIMDRIPKRESAKSRLYAFLLLGI